MKGIVFREFLEMVEEVFGMDVTDRIIEESGLPSGGAYTSVATYDHHEILTLVGKLHEQTQIPVADLVRAFGRHLFQRFVTLYPAFFVDVPSAFAFLERIDGIIHVEVRKLYPDAELPGFECEPLDPDRLVMTYRSQRPFAELAEGLIQGCVEHYKEAITIEREDLEGSPDETRARFLLTKRSAA
ncbi:heme NO-binding domain-containing protein [Singulisphaera rosea]